MLPLLDLKLKQHGREKIARAWVKAEGRLATDPDGAITSARTLLESTCQYCLEILGLPCATSDDLPKQYSKVANGFGITARQNIADVNKRMFGAIHTIVQAVGELRNKVGDAHGQASSEPATSMAQAELAVRLAFAATSFLLDLADSYVASAHHRTPDGKVILRFDRATVWRLVDHAQNATDTLPSYSDRRRIRGLWLVGDLGIYLMSNGSPPIYSDGKVSIKARRKNNDRLVAYASVCGLEVEFERWWPLHNAVANGSDFTLTIPLSKIKHALEVSKSEIVIVVNETSMAICGDTEFDEQ